MYIAGWIHISKIWLNFKIQNNIEMKSSVLLFYFVTAFSRNLERRLAAVSETT